MKLTKYANKVLEDDPRLTKEENAVENKLKNYSDPDSRNRVRRSMLGGPNTPETETEKWKIKQIVSGKTDSPYAYDLFNDFMKFNIESQPEVPQTRDRLINELRSKHPLKEGKKYAIQDYLPPVLSRESGLTYTPEFGYKYQFGLNTTTSDLMNGTMGSVDLNNRDYGTAKEGFTIHSHPELSANVRKPLNPSDEDKFNNSNWGANYLTQHGGNVPLEYSDKPLKLKRLFETDIAGLPVIDVMGQPTQPQSQVSKMVVLKNGKSLDGAVLDEFIDYVKKNSDIKVSKKFFKNASPERLKQLFSKVKMAGL